MNLYETHLAVRNTEKSTAFYVEIVGLDIDYHDPKRDIVFLWIGETTEPSVIGWMPSAQLYFRDPDEHLVEFITLLDDKPDPGFIGSLSEWRSKQ